MCVCMHVQANTFPPLNRQRPKCVGCKPWDSEPQTHVYQPWATIQGRAQGKPQLKSLRAMQTEKTCGIRLEYGVFNPYNYTQESVLTKAVSIVQQHHSLL